MTEIIRNPNRVIDKAFLDTVRKVLEEEKQIRIVNIFDKDDNVYGLFVHEVDKILSFLDFCEPIIETSIDNTKIVFFELGSVLYHIYNTGSIKFIDLFNISHQNIDHSYNYIQLYNKILKNIPFNIYVLTFLQAFNNMTSEYNEENIKDINGLKKSAVNMLQYVTGSQYYNEDFEEQKNFLNDEIVTTETDFLTCYNQLNNFVQVLKTQNFNKISEKNIYDINNLFVKIQKNI